MKLNHLAILTVRLGENPKLESMPAADSLKSLRSLVGGPICCRAISKSLRVVANDNGRLLRLPYNRCGFVGNVAVVKYSNAGNAITMRDADLAKAQDWLLRNDQRPPLCHVCAKPGGATMFCLCRDVLIYCVGCYYRLTYVLNGTEQQKRQYCFCNRCRTKK